MQMVQRVLEGAGAAYNLALGFIPDYVEILKRNDTITTAYILRWWGPLYEDDSATDAADQEYGMINTNGTQSEADANTGIQSYDGDKKPSVLIDSPKPGAGLVLASVADWLSTTSYSSGERTATTVGTIVRPPIHNGYVYELTTDTGNGTSEPTAGWSTTPGETCTDGGSNIWTCREENIANAGELGITIGATLAADSQILFVNAFKADSAKDIGDVA